MVIFAFMNVWSPIVVLVSSPLQTRFICLRRSSDSDWPSAEPETIDHSPCNRARSFLTASFSAAVRRGRISAISAVRIAIWIGFMCVDVIDARLSRYSWAPGSVGGAVGAGQDDRVAVGIAQPDLPMVGSTIMVGWIAMARQDDL